MEGSLQSLFISAGFVNKQPPLAILGSDWMSQRVETSARAVVSTRKRPFTEECSFRPDSLTNMAATGNSCFWLADL